MIGHSVTICWGPNTLGGTSIQLGSQSLLRNNVSNRRKGQTKNKKVEVGLILDIHYFYARRGLIRIGFLGSDFATLNNVCAGLDVCWDVDAGWVGRTFVQKWAWLGSRRVGIHRGMACNSGVTG